MFKRWPTGPEVRLTASGGAVILYDASRVGNAVADWLDADWWRAHGQVQPSPEGRGAALFVEAAGQRLVLRHYRRGGLAARLSTDRYLWRSAPATRSFAEWHLLYTMRHAGLPVPRPVAARFLRRGRSYRADLLIERIAAVRSLAAHLRQAALPLASWVAVGRCLQRFHEAGVYHADLNAHNILLGEDDAVWLIDFDRGRLRRPGLWCDANLARLRRSVEKITDPLAGEHFAEADWSSLLRGYFAAAAAAPVAG